MVFASERPRVDRTIKVDELMVEIYPDRAAMGEVAARDVAAGMKEIIARQGKVTMVFAAAPSQNEFLTTLTRDGDIGWDKVVAFHLDEYVGLPAEAPQGFGNFLRRNLFNKVRPRVVHFMNGNTPDLGQECRRYSDALAANPLDIACIGIGENGHLAFNDPPVADFSDPKTVKVVELDETCRMQQVNDGCFAHIDDVPRKALTMTIPAILSAKRVYCMVPGPSKAHAVQDTIRGPISTLCPASILRRCVRTTLYLDRESAKLI